MNKYNFFLQINSIYPSQQIPLNLSLEDDFDFVSQSFSKVGDDLRSGIDAIKATVDKTIKRNQTIR